MDLNRRPKNLPPNEETSSKMEEVGFANDSYAEASRPASPPSPSLSVFLAGALLGAGSEDDHPALPLQIPSDPFSIMDDPLPHGTHRGGPYQQQPLPVQQSGLRQRPPRKTIWTCTQCQQGLFRSKTQLTDHKRSEHTPSVRIRSKQEGQEDRILAELLRDPTNKMFQCRCGSRFRSTRNAPYHSKCYEGGTATEPIQDDAAQGKEQEKFWPLFTNPISLHRHRHPRYYFLLFSCRGSFNEFTSVNNRFGCRN